MNSFYSDEELKALGLKSYGKNVKISRKASIYNADRIMIGDHVRIDDFCVLSGNICLGNYVHIVAYVALYGGCAGIDIKDFAGVSSRTAIYAATDDYSGEAMAHPTIPDNYRNVYEAGVVLEEHTIIATGCTILPGVKIGKGSAVGAMSLVRADLEAWGIYAGIPVKYIKPRSKKLLELEQRFLEEQRGTTD